MKKTILAALAAAMTLGTMSAENAVYFYDDDNGYPYGFLNRVSANGLWAIGCDDGFQTGSFIVDVENAPEKLNRIDGGELYAISNEGVAVGAYYRNVGTEEVPILSQMAAVYSDGEWQPLELPASVYGRSWARCISADGSVIGGMINCRDESSETGARYYPAVWRYSEEAGDYVLTCYNNINLPFNQGFTLFDMNEDGSILVGNVYAHAGSTIPAIIRNGELEIWNELEWKPWPFVYNGETWYVDTAFIDGMIEDDPMNYMGSFNCLKGDYAFGHRMIFKVDDPVTCEGTATHHRTIYNLATGEFTDTPSATYYSYGIDADHAFIIGGTDGLTALYLADGKQQNIAKLTGVTTDEKVSVVYSGDDSNRVFVGSSAVYNDVVGLYETPVLIVLDEALVAGVSAVEADAQPADSHWYDLTGRCYEQEPTAPGVYIHNRTKYIKR